MDPRWVWCEGRSPENQERTGKPPSRVRGARPHLTAGASTPPRSHSTAAARATSRQRRGGGWILGNVRLFGCFLNYLWN